MYFVDFSITNRTANAFLALLHFMFRNYISWVLNFEFSSSAQHFFFSLVLFVLMRFHFVSFKLVEKSYPEVVGCRAKKIQPIHKKTMAIPKQLNALKQNNWSEWNPNGSHYITTKMPHFLIVTDLFIYGTIKHLWGLFFRPV